MTGQIKPKRILMIFAAILALYTVAGFFLFPFVGKKILLKQLGNALGRPVAIESVSMNPYSLVVGIKGISIKEKTGTDFILIQSLLVNLSASSLFRFAPVITRLELESPVVNLIEKKDETFNFSDLILRFAKDSSKTVTADPEIFGFKLSNVKIFNGKISFSDQIRETNHLIEKINLDLPFLSSLEKDRQTKASPKIDFLLNQAKIKIKLESLPFTPGRNSVLTLKTGTIDLLKYLGYLPLPETLLVKQMETILDLTITYSQANDNMILEGAVTLANIDIQDADHTPVLTTPQINLAIAPSDLLDKKLTLSDLNILSPKIHLGRDADGNLNLLKYLPGDKVADQGEDNLGKEVAQETGQGETGQDEAGQGETGIGFVFELMTGEIKDASLFFTDGANKTPFKTTLSPVSIQLKDVVAQKGVLGKYRISLKSEAGESFASKGQFSTIPLGVEGSITLEKLVVKKYSPYFENLINFDIRDGQVNLDAGFSISKNQTKLGAVFNNKKLRISDLKLWDRVNKEIPVSIPELIITGSVMDTEKQRLDMGEVKTFQGKIILKRQSDGSINLVKNLLSASNNLPVNKADTAKAPGAIPVVKKKEPEWKISLDDFSMEKFGIAFFDATTKEPVSIKMSDIGLHAGNFKTWGREKAGIKAGMEWNKTGKMRIKGDLVPSIMRADLDLSLEEIDITSLQPYFTDQVNIVVGKGFFHTQGQIAVSMEEKANPSISFKGKTSVTDFVSSGKDTDKEFFNCDSLYLAGMDITLFPLKVIVKDISLTDFYSRVIISEKGNINLKQILVSDGEGKIVSGPEPATAKEEETGPLPEIIISNVTLQGGHIHYADYFTQPNVIAEMKEITGQIKGLSSMDDTPAAIQLQGLHGQSSPLDIVGRISPLSRKRFLDLDISFKDIDLTRFSPYAAKYIGYKIEKGKLVLDLKYKIEKNLLESQNRLFLDQFTLGKKVDSKDATSLPVPLAISLLKNSNDQIDLNLPLTGDLDDPEFNFSSALFAVFGNLIIKVTAAPFKFLGAMFGGGEELGFINFEYGSHKISNEGIKKLDKLMEILDKKKELDLEIKGTYESIQDGEALRLKRYEALLKSGEIAKIEAVKGTKASSQEDLVLLPEEREEAILAAYVSADFPKPRGEDGKEKQISTGEKEKLLFTHLDIKENHLKELAMTRAENIKNYILSTGKVVSERIFFNDPDQAKADPEQKRLVRVNFLIK
ncbi:MAG: DUF748 domain-containing protein [Desulfobacteraceae bacterium]|nr:DUF748 domain-containing protein [Desulfobacteraceae bacterium]